MPAGSNYCVRLCGMAAKWGSNKISLGSGGVIRAPIQYHMGHKLPSYVIWALGSPRSKGLW